MLYTKTLTGNICRLIMLALISAGVFSFFGCESITLRSDDTDTVQSDSLYSTVKTSELQTDGEIAPAHRFEKPADKPREISNEAAEWIELYKNRFGDGSADEIIMEQSEITEFNKQIADFCPTVVDFEEFAEILDGSSVREMILHYSLPAGDKFDDSGEYISSEQRGEILANRNLDAISDTVEVRRAVVTSLCGMSAFPTDVEFHNYGDTYYNGIRETEIPTGFPVLVLHESADEEFIFVQSYYYYGWIPADSAAYCGEEEFESFIDPERFITLTAPYYSVDIAGYEHSDIMGTVLQYLSEDDDSFYVNYPIRNDDGMLEFIEVKIDKSAAVFGYLPYTAANYYNQAFAFLGTMYGWGGDGGVDCSGFVCAVFRTFGIYLPRNTGEQSLYSGTIHSLEGLSSQNSAEVLGKLDKPSSIHRKGHVMLYLGAKEGAHYVIHAPEGGKKVSVMALGLPGNLISAISVASFEN